MRHLQQEEEQDGLITRLVEEGNSASDGKVKPSSTSDSQLWVRNPMWCPRTFGFWDNYFSFLTCISNHGFLSSPVSTSQLSPPLRGAKLRGCRAAADWQGGKEIRRSFSEELRS